MYTKERLEQYEYFKDLDMEYVLDALTGTISRGYIIGLVKYLIENKNPFSFAILDLDNFKLINDNYGHSIGDECLSEVAKSFIEYIGDDGLVGRYGGDEFIILYFCNDPSYDNVHEFYTRLYHDKLCIRRTIELSTVRLFVTATTGAASYPYDATTYEDLFEKADKALYRGKSKGRNCYIVYVDEKHRDIDVHRKDNSYLPDMFQAISRCIDDDLAFEKNVKTLLEYLLIALGSTDCIVVFDNICVEAYNMKKDLNIKKPSMEDFSILFDNNMDYIVTNQLRDYKMKSPGINRYMTGTNTQSIMAFKLGTKKPYGYLAVMENRLLRVWQEKEVSLAMYVSKIISILYKMKKN